MYIVDEIVDNLPEVPNVPLAMASLAQPTSLEQWHRRLVHCSPLTITKMSTRNLVNGLKVSGNDLHGKCEDCIIRWQTRRPFNEQTKKDLAPLELVSFDLWGPSRVQSAGGKTYFMPILDGGTSFKYGAYLSDKSDSSTIPAFNAFRIEAESMSGHKIRRLRTDHAYDSAAWADYCQKHGIVHEFTAPYSSAQNGLAKRAIRTTLDDVRTLLHDSGLTHSYWAEAASYSVHTRNLVPSRRHLGKIPLESFTGKRQDISYLRVFGAKCWAKIPTVHGAQITGGSKLDPRTIECHLLGYAGGRDNYKVQDLVSRCVFVSRDVVFEEDQPHRTSASVGENIPLFDATLENHETTLAGNEVNNQQATDQHDTPSSGTVDPSGLISPRNLFNRRNYAAHIESLNPPPVNCSPRSTNSVKRPDRTKVKTGPPIINTPKPASHSTKYPLIKMTTSPASLKPKPLTTFHAPTDMLCLQTQIDG